MFFCPGPIKSEFIDKNIIMHRSKDFHNLYSEVKKNTLKLFNIEKLYSVLILNGSGSLAIESILYTYVSKRKTLILSNGYFGEKWVNILSNYSNNFIHLQFGWNNEFNYEKIESIIKDIEIIFFVHNETSTGMINDVHKLNNLCNKYDKELISDMVSSVGAYNINLNKLNKLVLLGYSVNKAIGAMPGISIVIGKNNIFNKNDKIISYLNLNLYYIYSLKNETPFTFSSNLLLIYNNALNHILDKNLNNIEINLDKNKIYLINELKKLNIYTKLNNNISNWVINFTISNPIELYDYLYKNNIIVYKCKDKLLNNTIQICILNQNQNNLDILIDYIKKFITNN